LTLRCPGKRCAAGGDLSKPGFVPVFLTRFHLVLDHRGHDLVRPCGRAHRALLLSLATASGGGATDSTPEGLAPSAQNAKPSQGRPHHRFCPHTWASVPSSLVSAAGRHRSARRVWSLQGLMSGEPPPEWRRLPRSTATRGPSVRRPQPLPGPPRPPETGTAPGHGPWCRRTRRRHHKPRRAA
jgi:hypothetical protein